MDIAASQKSGQQQNQPPVARTCSECEKVSKKPFSLTITLSPPLLKSSAILVFEAGLILINSIVYFSDPFNHKVDLFSNTF